MRETILYIAVSLDGMIAGEHDDLSFLNGYDDVELVKTSYQDLMNQIDTIVMGKRTYDYVMNMGDWPYEGYQTYVVTSSHDHSSYATFIKENPQTLIKRLQEQKGKAIWIVGGAKLVQALLKEDLIDTFVIATIPVLLGKGVRLFEDIYKTLDFVDVKQEKGMILATYQRTAK